MKAYDAVRAQQLAKLLEEQQWLIIALIEYEEAISHLKAIRVEE